MMRCNSGTFRSGKSINVVRNINRMAKSSTDWCLNIIIQILKGHSFQISFNTRCG
jgi:hypothetical protein